MTPSVWQVLAVLAGLLFAELVSRLIATRKPNDTPSAPANFAWYGRDAVAAIQQRPGAARLLGPVLLASASLLVRSPISSAFVLGTLLALMRGVCLWYVAPSCFRVKNPNEMSGPNRLLALEQTAVQDEIEQLFWEWDQTPTLAAAQRGEVRGPLGERPLVEICEYTVQEGDDLDELLMRSGVSLAEIVRLNLAYPVRSQLPPTTPRGRGGVCQRTKKGHPRASSAESSRPGGRS